VNSSPAVLRMGGVMNPYAVLPVCICTVMLAVGYMAYRLFRRLR
jgi:hypothetical protein